MVNYDAQVGQIPAPYYSSTGSRKRKIGNMIAGGLIGMNAYYLPVSKDVFVQRGFEIKRNDNYNKIITLKNIAKEIENNKLSTESKIILQEFGLAHNANDIANKCIDLDREVNDASSVKNIKDKFINDFDNFKKHVSLMDSESADAFKAVKRNKFKWGAGIGAAIGLAIGLMTSND